tara:strand:+ start:379 stop:1404 length:1026 start_codon:yes stop_codon:yes gene_type:complete
MRGLYRILTIGLEYYIPKIALNIPYKSYIVVIAYFLTNYILAEKILKLLGFCIVKRILVFYAITGSFLIIPTAFTWVRTQNELVSILISWVFVWLITKSKNGNISIIFFMIWGLIALLTYELHFPFIGILIISMGFVSRKKVFLLFVSFSLLSIIIPLGSHKVNLGGEYFYSSIKNILPYIENKFVEALFSLEKVDTVGFYLPFFGGLVFFIFSYIHFNNVHVSESNMTLLSELEIVLLTTILVALVYMISWPENVPPNFNTILSFGKLNWNILYCAWLNICIALILRNYNPYVFLLRLSPIFIMIVYSGLLVRSIKTSVTADNLDVISKTLFKNVYMYLF